MIKKIATGIRARELGNGQAAVEWPVILAVVLGIAIVAFAAIGTANKDLLTSFTTQLTAAKAAVDKTVMPK